MVEFNVEDHPVVRAFRACGNAPDRVSVYVYAWDRYRYDEITGTVQAIYPDNMQVDVETDYGTHTYDLKLAKYRYSLGPVTVTPKHLNGFKFDRKRRKRRTIYN